MKPDKPRYRYDWKLKAWELVSPVPRFITINGMTASEFYSGFNMPLSGGAGFPSGSGGGGRAY